MSFTLNNISSLFGLTPKKMSEGEKTRRILASAAAQRTELHIVFGQRLARPTPIRGRFAAVEADRLCILLDTAAVYDAWQSEPCSVYFSVRCAELSGSYAFTSRILGHQTRDNITRAHLALPHQCITRQVRRFERLSPATHMVQRMAVWNLKGLSLGHLPPMQALRAMSHAHEPPPLSTLLPPRLQNLGPADFQRTQNATGCELVNVSAGGARMRLSLRPSQMPYAEGDNLLLVLALSRQKQPPLLVSLAGACLGAGGGCEQGLDVKMRFIYWNNNQATELLKWAPVTLRGVLPLFDWVAEGLGVNEDTVKGVDTTFGDNTP